MKTFTAFSFAAAASLVAAQSLSTDCSNALKGVLASSDASCLNPSSLLSFFVGNNQSVPTTINSWLTGLCSSGFCSNDTLAEVVTNSHDNLGASVPATLTQLVQEVYPTVRNIVCLKDNASNQLCVTETLNHIEDVAGKLSLDDFNIAALLSQVQKVIMGAQNLACTNCTKAAFSLASQIAIPDFAQAVDGVDALCGANFIESGSSLDADGVTQTALNEAFSTKSNDAPALAMNKVGAVLLVVLSGLVFA
ncbi:hypothetical protein C8F01DRAFT_1102971 [Mycena amicta]|nr:hypothetical protein C8F01DRAFT_1102971 [Mycena amicta]